VTEEHLLRLRPPGIWPVVITILIIFIILENAPLPAQNNSRTQIKDIPLPDSSYRRLPVNPGSFGEWLRNLILQPKGSAVLTYKGKVFKSSRDTTVAAVVDMDIQGRKHEQCMDILVRLYAEYIWQNNRAMEMNLPLPGGAWLSWLDWRKGLRPVFSGINMKLKLADPPDSSFQNYEKYLRLVYSESHTQQFYHALKRIDMADLQIGDFIVSRGSKNHAVMIVDMARNDKNQLIVLVGHGDTPACEFYLLSYRKNNPWFPARFEQGKLPLPIKRQMPWEGLRRFMQR
jgi:hypothetical protein